MPGGMNVLFRVYRLTQSSDDSIGGAVFTGSAVGDFYGRFNEEKPSKMLLEQGIEVARLGTVLLRYHKAADPNALTIEERDQIEIVRPIQHPFYGKRFHILSIQHMPTHPNQRRNLIRMSVRRADWDRTEEDV